MITSVLLSAIRLRLSFAASDLLMAKFRAADRRKVVVVKHSSYPGQKIYSAASKLLRAVDREKRLQAFHAQWDMMMALVLMQHGRRAS